MVYKLTQEQADMYEEGGWSAWRLEEDVLEDLDREGVTEPVAVVTPDASAVVFWVSAKGVRI